MEDMIQQMSRLMLMMEANMNSMNQCINSLSTSTGLGNVSSIPGVSNFPNASRSNERIARCIWCDATDHSRRDLCSDFLDKLKNGLIRMNENNHIAMSVSGEEIPTMFGRGGMKKLFDLQYNPIIVVNRNVTADMCNSIEDGNPVAQSSLSANVNSTSEEVIASSNLIVSKSLYTCPSGRANTSLENGKAKVSAFLDNGSEILMMSK